MKERIKTKLMLILKGPINYLPQHKIKFSIWLLIIIICLTDLETFTAAPIIWLFTGWLSSRNIKLEENEHPSAVTAPVTFSTNISLMYETKFRVAGISDKNIQRAIRSEIVEDYLSYSEPYGGMSNKEILEFGDDVYEVDVQGDDEITLVPEPDNPYNKKAIRVEHERIGKIGYVPDYIVDEVHKIISKNDYTLEWRLLGGKVKKIEYDEEKGKDVVKVQNLTYGIEITLTEYK